MRSLSSIVGALGVIFFVAAPGCRSSAPEAAPVQAATIPPMPDATGPASLTVPPSSTSVRCVKPMASAAPAIPPPASDAACPRDPQSGGSLPTAEIAFPDASPSLKITAEIASTPESIEKGLMYRRSMSEGAGMLFVMDDHRDHTFWMHNTCIPLDMLFVESDGFIAGIVEGAAPLTDTIRSVGCASSYVLEVNGGWARRHNVKPGQIITIPNIPR